MSDAAEGIAVIGLAGRFPRCANALEFWQRLRDGEECITHFTEQELLDVGIPAEALRRPGYVRANGVVDDVDRFDAAFFGFNPRDAEVLDPQQRMFLECAWEALEDSGRVPDRHAGPVGVFAGASLSTYAFQLYNNPALAGLVSDFQILISNDKDHLATRVAYKLNLQGPALSVGTACSTSLVATCLAAQSLLDYQCDLALAGGVSLGVPMHRGYQYEAGGISSPDGHCRPFDADAMGTVGGNGCAVVVLKRLADAIADGDPIRAVILGFGLNNDGSSKVGYTAPSIDGQAAAIAAALAMADVHPDTITMMEAHGTATPLGDPIEIAALSQAWRRSTRRRYCALGSLKSNMGHLDSAAGAAGLIKCVLALQHRQIPPSLHFRAPNPKLDLDNTPFRVNTALQDWLPEEGVRRAAVSSFGIGGTNAHVILEEAPAGAPAMADVSAPGSRRAIELLPLSARSPAALEQLTQRLAAHLEQRPELALAEVAHTLQVGRSAFAHRRVLLAPGPDSGEALRRLRARDARQLLSGRRDEQLEGVAFLLPGQGAQHGGMARGLYRDESQFRAVLQTCAEILRPRLGVDLAALIHDEHADEILRQTQITQPAVFAVSYALGRLWMQWGVAPAALIGHSVGEYTAACLAGVFTLEEGLSLMAERGRLLASMPAGAMLAVALPEAALHERFGKELDIAAVNGAAACVLAGPVAAIEAAREQLEGDGEIAQRLQTSHAFHSRLMDAAVEPMRQAIARIALQAPRIPCISNVSGRWLKAEEATDPDYWARHLRAPVRFADGLGQLLRDTRARLLEVGPGTTLSHLARAHGARASNRPVISSCRHPQDSADDRGVLLQALGRLWLSGLDVDWAALRGQGALPRRLSLPTYPFERERYWIDAPTMAAASIAAMPAEHEARLPIEDWLYRPHWLRLASLPPPDGTRPPAADHLWVLLGGPDDVGRALAQSLADEGHAVRTLGSPQQIAELAPGSLTVVSLAGLQPSPGGAADFGAALALLQALSRRTETARVLFVTQRLFAVGAADPAADVEAAGLLGPLLVAPQEYPQLRCQALDLDRAAVELLLAGHGHSLIAEARASEPLPWLAHRGAQRWSLSFEPTPLAAVPSPAAARLDGCYIVTGGLGRIGLLIADLLARRGARAVLLVGRGGVADASARRAIDGMQALGTRLRIHAADVSIPDQAAQVVAAARALGGRVDGVFHAAGLTGAEHFGDFGSIDSSSLRPHCAAKHQGAAALAAALDDDPPAFFCAMSSISTVLGGIGFAAYAAANAMLDSWIAGRGQGPTRWISIGWDGWQFAAEPEPEPEAEAGSAVGGDAGAAASGADGSAGTDAAGGDGALILRGEGIDVLERVLAATDLSRVIVAVSPLGPRLYRWVLGHGTSPGATAPAATARQGHARPELSTAFEPPAPGRQTLIADIWRELLGLDQVGAHDNFFELGGHSLLAIQVVSRLRQATGADVAVRLLFDHPTVVMLDAALDAVRPGPALDGAAAGNGSGQGQAQEPGPDRDPGRESLAASDEEIAQLLGRIEAMPDSEVDALLRGKAGG
ncbi:MAG: SDR family NAD(P)-dependent oxidoreductase [Burkholderiaceae bacterium]